MSNGTCYSDYIFLKTSLALALDSGDYAMVRLLVERVSVIHLSDITQECGQNCRIALWDASPSG